MADKLRRTEEAAALHDSGNGNCYLALDATYTSPPHLRRCVGFCRVSVTLLNFLLFASALLGHILPYCQTPHGMERWYVWVRAWLNGGDFPYLDLRDDALLMRVSAAAAVLTGLVAFLVPTVLPGQWSSAEAARLTETNEKKRLRELYSHECKVLLRGAVSGLAEGLSGASTIAPAANAVLISRDQPSRVPLKETGNKGYCTANRVATISLVCLSVATLSSLGTVVSMWMDYCVVRRNEEDAARLSLGFTCFLVCSICGVLSTALSLKPVVAHVRLLMRDQAVSRCLLSEVPDSVSTAIPNDAASLGVGGLNIASSVANGIRPRSAD